MARKKTKFCLSWPNKTLEISRRLRNIAVLLTGRTITSQSNFILPLSLLFYRMWRHFLLDDPNIKKSARRRRVFSPAPGLGVLTWGKCDPVGTCNSFQSKIDESISNNTIYLVKFCISTSWGVSPWNTCLLNLPIQISEQITWPTHLGFLHISSIKTANYLICDKWVDDTNANSFWSKSVYHSSIINELVLQIMTEGWILHR